MLTHQQSNGKVKEDNKCGTKLYLPDKIGTTERISHLAKILYKNGQHKFVLKQKMITNTTNQKQGGIQGVVYKGNCLNCNSTHIIETERKLKQEQTDTNKMLIMMMKVKFLDCQVILNHRSRDRLGNTEILYRDHNQVERKFRDMAEIKRCKYGVMNKNEEITSISHILQNLIL